MVQQYPVFGYDAYPTLELKAANLMYLLIKDHVFIDGNKRVGVFALGMLLEKNNQTLTATNENLQEFAEKVASVNPLEPTFQKEQFIVLMANWINNNSESL